MAQLLLLRNLVAWGAYLNRYSGRFLFTCKQSNLRCLCFSLRCYRVPHNVIPCTLDSLCCTFRSHSWLFRWSASQCRSSLIHDVSNFAQDNFLSNFCFDFSILISLIKKFWDKSKWKNTRMFSLSQQAMNICMLEVANAVLTKAASCKVFITLASASQIRNL